MTLLFGRTQDAYGTPFDPTDPNAVAANFSSNTVQAAIIEARNEAPGQASRYNLFFGFDGSAGTTRWLEQSKSIPSNTSPFVVPEKSIVRTLTISNENNVTATMTLFRNGVAVASVSTSAARIGVVSGLNIALNVGDTLSARSTSGTFAKPAFNIGIQVTP